MGRHNEAPPPDEKRDILREISEKRDEPPTWVDLAEGAYLRAHNPKEAGSNPAPAIST